MGASGLQLQSHSQTQNPYAQEIAVTNLLRNIPGGFTLQVCGCHSGRLGHLQREFCARSTCGDDEKGTSGEKNDETCDTCKAKTWLSDDLKIGEMTCRKGFYNCSLHDGQ